MLNLINSILPVLCLCIGFFLGFKFNNKEVPTEVKHPIRYVKAKKKEKQETEKIKEEIDYLNDVLFNIENYDGTPQGQKTVKRGSNS